MPTLKQINCSLELGPNNTKLKEYGARYSDGHVEAFVAVPDTDIPFTIHLTTNGYIAPGIAIFVFMDGEYQCNRNRHGLKLPGDGVQPQDYETEFRVRQKEEKTSSGTFVVREWSFAKLNRVAADKAPNLNPQFTNNVGTVEVIILRCKTDILDHSPPRVLQSKTQDKPAPRKIDKRSAPAAPAASDKVANQEGSMIGGLFGLFDGAYDDINLDGVADELPVGPDGRVRPHSPPGWAFDPVAGQFVPKEALIPPTDVRNVLNLDESINDQVYAIAGNLKDASAQLDGPAGYPGVVINQWGDRTRDDVRGDKYLGLEDQTRSEYKQYLRETGQSVSSHPGYGQGRNARFNAAAGNVQAERGPPRPDSANVAQKLETMRLGFVKYLQEHQDHREEAQQDLAIIMRLQRLQRLGDGGLSKFPMWLAELLTDVEIRRQYAIRLQQTHQDMDFSRLKAELENEQTKALLDVRYWKEFSLHQIGDAMELQAMFSGRVVMLEKFVEKAESFSQLSTQNLRARIQFVTYQRDRAREMVKDLELKAQANDNIDEARGWNRNKPAHPHGGREVGDGAFPNEWANPNAFQGDNAGFQQVGAGKWDPVNRRDEQPQSAMNPQWSGGQQQGQGWPAANKQDKPSNAEQDNGWVNNEKPDGDRSGSKVDHQEWQGGNDGWKNSDSRKTYEHDFSDAGNQKNDRSRSQTHHSIHQSNNASGWNNNDDDKSQFDGNWGNSGSSKKGGNDGWNGGSKDKSKSSSRSKTRSVRTAINTQDDPTAHIKPYWKDWNKPFGRNEASDSHPKKMHDEPREAYTYPASNLPAVPKKDVKDASHGIQTSKGADYIHKTHRPTYIDTMERPYAVFSFKYRSKEVLEKILRIKVDGKDLRNVQKQAEEARLSALPKHKLIEELMAKRAPQKSGSKESGKSYGSGARSSRSKPSRDNDGDNGWKNQRDNAKPASNGWASKKNEGSWGNEGSGKDKKSTGNRGSKQGGHSSKKSEKGGKGTPGGWDSNETKKNNFSLESKGNQKDGGWNQPPNEDNGDDNFAGW